jgi:RNA recognition motif-containing protein
MKSELYVGSISFKATEEDLFKLFSLCGTVTSIHLITDSATGQFKGCGYVRMSTAEQAKDAVETLNDALLIDKIITVSIARPNPQTKTRPFFGDRKKTAQGQGKRPSAPKGRTGR